MLRKIVLGTAVAAPLVGWAAYSLTSPPDLADLASEAPHSLNSPEAPLGSHWAPWIYMHLGRGIRAFRDPEKAHRDAIKVAALSPGVRRMLGLVHPSVDYPRLHTQIDFASPAPAAAAASAASSSSSSSATLVVNSLSLPHPLGLAAGFDKHGEAVGGLGDMGFSFVEIGSVTPLPQPGNVKPRVFRLESDRAIINRYGFNSEGAEAVAKRLELRAQQLALQDAAASSSPSARPLVGINLGKNKLTPAEGAVADYEKGLESLAQYADYLVINVSSPNTPGLRNLQHERELSELLRKVKSKRDEIFINRARALSAQGLALAEKDLTTTTNSSSSSSTSSTDATSSSSTSGTANNSSSWSWLWGSRGQSSASSTSAPAAADPKLKPLVVPVPPLFVKVAPDLTPEERSDVARVVLSSGIDGLIVSNTTLARDGLRSYNRTQEGGLSGRPLKHLSTEVIRDLYNKTHGQVKIIGVGGIETGQDAYDKIRAGASLLQVYSSFALDGPCRLHIITRDLNALLERDKLTVQQAVGADADPAKATAAAASAAASAAQPTAGDPK